MQQPTTTKREATASVLDYVDDKYTEVSGCVCLKTYLPVSRVAQNACHWLRNHYENRVFFRVSRENLCHMTLHLPSWRRKKGRGKQVLNMMFVLVYLACRHQNLSALYAITL